MAGENQTIADMTPLVGSIPDSTFLEVDTGLLSRNVLAGQLRAPGALALTFANPQVIDADDSGWQTLVATADTTLSFVGVPVEGQSLVLAITASGADRHVTLPASIVIPASSDVTSPVTVTAGTEMLVELRYRALNSKWRLFSLITGY